MTRFIALLLAAPFLLLPTGVFADDGAAPRETPVAAPHGVSVVVRMQGPYDAETPLQVVCFFKWNADSLKRSSGAPVELDKRLGGLITALRSRGEFTGDDLETMLLDAPDGTIKPKRLLLIGLGDELSLSLAKLERVGAAALRTASRIGATQVAFAPLIRDQGNTTIPTGDVEVAVLKGMLLAYDTERRLQQQGFAKPFALTTWVVEAGPAYFDETVAGAKRAAVMAQDAIAARNPAAYSTVSKRP